MVPEGRLLGGAWRWKGAGILPILNRQMAGHWPFNESYVDTGFPLEKRKRQLVRETSKSRENEAFHFNTRDDF
jgi:hypothetical protein